MFFFQAEDGIRDGRVTGVQTCALPIYRIVTVFKILPILVFIVVLFVNFNAGVFSDNWTAYGYGDLGDLNEQVRNTRSEERRVGKECRSEKEMDESKKSRKKQVIVSEVL